MADDEGYEECVPGQEDCVDMQLMAAARFLRKIYASFLIC